MDKIEDVYSHHDLDDDDHGKVVDGLLLFILLFHLLLPFLYLVLLIFS